MSLALSSVSTCPPHHPDVYPKLGENYFCPDIFDLFSLRKRQVFQKSTSVSKPSEYSWVCFEDGVVNRDKNTYTKPGMLRRMSLLETGILRIILIYSQLIETYKLSTSKFKYVVLLLGIPKSLMWVRHLRMIQITNSLSSGGVVFMLRYFYISVTITFMENELEE